MPMDSEGLLNPGGLWNRRGAWLAGSMVAAGILGFDFSFLGQILAAFAIFALAWLVLLAAAFVVGLLAWAGAQGVVRLARPAETLVVQAPAIGRVNFASPWIAARGWLTQPIGPWKWPKVEWADVRNISRMDEWRRGRSRPADSQPPQHRRAA